MSQEEEDLYIDVFLKPEERVDPDIIRNLKQEIEQLQLEKDDLRNTIDKLANANSAISKENQTLKTNISSLYKTAQNELERKTRMIDQMRIESIGKSRTGVHNNPSNERIHHSSSSNLQQKDSNSSSQNSTGSNPSPSNSNHNRDSHRHDRHRDRHGDSRGDQYHDNRHRRYANTERYSEARGEKTKHSDRPNDRLNDKERPNRLSYRDRPNDKDTRLSDKESSKDSSPSDKERPNDSKSGDYRHKMNGHAPSLNDSKQTGDASKGCDASKSNPVNPSKSEHSDALKNNPANPSKNEQVSHKNDSPLLPKPNLIYSTKNSRTSNIPPKPPLPKEKIVVQGPPTVFSRRLGVRINNENKKLHQESMLRYLTSLKQGSDKEYSSKTTLCEPSQEKKTESTAHASLNESKSYPKQSSNTNSLLRDALTSNVNKPNPNPIVVQSIQQTKPVTIDNPRVSPKQIQEPEKKIPGSQNEAVSPTQINAHEVNKAPCSSLIDKIKQIEQSVNTSKIDEKVVSSEPIKSKTVVTSTPKEKTSLVKTIPSPTLQNNKDSSIPGRKDCKKTVAISPPPTMPQRKVPELPTTKVSHPFSIFEPEVQLHCESSCESNFGEALAPNTATPKSSTPKGKLSQQVLKRNCKSELKVNPWKTRTSARVSKCSPCAKPANKAALSSVDFIPVYNLEMSDKHSAQSEPRSKTRLLAGNRPCLKLGEVSIKLASSGKNVSKPSKLSPHSSSLTKVDVKSSQEDTESKNQNNQNEANCPQPGPSENHTHAPYDEDSQDIVVSVRKRKFVIVDSEDENSLPASKKPTLVPEIKTQPSQKNKQVPEQRKENRKRTKSKCDLKEKATNACEPIETKDPVVKEVKTNDLPDHVADLPIPTGFLTDILNSVKTVETAQQTAQQNVPQVISHFISNTEPTTDLTNPSSSKDISKEIIPVLSQELPRQSQSSSVDQKGTSALQDVSSSPRPDQRHDPKISALQNNSSDLFNTTGEISVSSENDVSLKTAENDITQRTEGDTSLTLLSQESVKSSVSSSQNTSFSNRRENKFSLLSKRRSMRMGKAQIKTITVTSPEKKETIVVNNKYDTEEVDLKKRGVDFNNKEDEKVNVKEVESSECKEGEKFDCKERENLNRTENSDSKDSDEKEIEKIFENKGLASEKIENTITEVATNVHKVEPCLSVTTSMTSTNTISNTTSDVGTPATISETTSKVAQKPSLLEVDDSTLDANDIVGRVLRDGTKPVLNLNISRSSELCEDDGIGCSQNSENNPQPELVRSSTPKDKGEDFTQSLTPKDKGVAVTAVTPKEHIVRAIERSTPTVPVMEQTPEASPKPLSPVRIISSQSPFQAKPTCSFEEMDIVSDPKWKATNAGLKNESFNYSGKKPKKRISHYVKPSDSPSPGSKANANVKRTPDKLKAFKSKLSPLKKELAQAITTSYKVASFRDIISTQPVQKSEKINVLTPRKSPKIATPMKTVEVVKPSVVEGRKQTTPTTVTCERQGAVLTKTRDAGSSKKQSIMQRDIKLKLKAINNDSEQNVQQPSSLSNINSQLKPFVAPLTEKTNMSSVMTRRSEVHSNLPSSSAPPTPHFLIPEALEDNARFVSITTRTSTITSSSTSTCALPEQPCRTTFTSKSKRCTSFESNSSSSISLFTSTLSDVQHRNEHTLSPFQDALSLMNQTPFKQLMTGTFSCVSPMAQTPYKADATPCKETPDTSEERSDPGDERSVYRGLQTPIKPIITSSCSSDAVRSAEMQALQDELALTPDGHSGVSELSSEPHCDSNDIKCYVESMQRDSIIRPCSTQNNGILAIHTNHSVFTLSEALINSGHILAKETVTTEPPMAPKSTEKAPPQTNSFDTEVSRKNNMNNFEIIPSESKKTVLSTPEKVQIKSPVRKVQQKTPDSVQQTAKESPKDLFGDLKKDDHSTTGRIRKDSRGSTGSKTSQRDRNNSSSLCEDQQENRHTSRRENQNRDTNPDKRPSSNNSPEVNTNKRTYHGSEDRSRDRDKSRNRITNQNQSPNENKRDKSRSPRRIRFTSENDRSRAQGEERTTSNDRQRKPVHDKQSSDERYCQGESSKHNDRSPNNGRKRRRSPSPRYRDRSRHYSDRRDRVSPDRRKEMGVSPDRKYKERIPSPSDRSKRRYSRSPNGRERDISDDRKNKYSNQNARARGGASPSRNHTGSSEKYRERRDRDKSRRRGEYNERSKRFRDHSGDRQRKYRDHSPERAREASPRRSRKENSPERSRQKGKSPQRINETPVKKVIVKEILYYTQSSLRSRSSHSEDDKESSRKRQASDSRRDKRGEVSEEPRSRNEEPRSRNEEPRSRNEEPRSRNDESISRNEESRSRNDEPRSRNEESRSRNDEPRSRNEEPRSRNEEHRSRNVELSKPRRSGTDLKARDDSEHNRSGTKGDKHVDSEEEYRTRKDKRRSIDSREYRGDLSKQKATSSRQDSQDSSPESNRQTCSSRPGNSRRYGTDNEAVNSEHTRTLERNGNPDRNRNCLNNNERHNQGRRESSGNESRTHVDSSSCRSGPTNEPRDHSEYKRDHSVSKIDNLESKKRLSESSQMVRSNQSDQVVNQTTRTLGSEEEEGLCSSSSNDSSSQVAVKV